MKYGLNENEILQIQTVLAAYPEVEKAILYGSRAKGNYQPASDIDLTLEGHKLNLELLLDIENQLDDLLLPYKIDLSLLHTIDNTALVEHIQRLGIVFYTATNTPNSLRPSGL